MPHTAPPSAPFLKPTATSTKRIAPAQVIPFTRSDARGYYCIGGFTAAKFKNRRTSGAPAVQPNFNNMTPADSAQQVVNLDSMSNPRNEAGIHNGVAIVETWRFFAKPAGEMPIKTAREIRRRNKITAKKIAEQEELNNPPSSSLSPSKAAGTKRKRQNKKNLDQDLILSSSHASQPTLLELATPAPPPQLKPRATPQKKKKIIPPNSDDETSDGVVSPPSATPRTTPAITRLAPPASATSMVLIDLNSEATVIPNQVVSSSTVATAVAASAEESGGEEPAELSPRPSSASPSSSQGEMSSSPAPPAPPPPPPSTCLSNNNTPTDDVPLEEVFGGRAVAAAWTEVPRMPSLPHIVARPRISSRPPSFLDQPVTPMSPLSTDKLPREFSFSSAPGTPYRQNAPPPVCPLFEDLANTPFSPPIRSILTPTVADAVAAAIAVNNIRTSTTPPSTDTADVDPPAPLREDSSTLSITSLPSTDSSSGDLTSLKNALDAASKLSAEKTAKKKKSSKKQPNKKKNNNPKEKKHPKKHHSK